MQLTPAQHDALSEIANIGASRAAKQLSLLLDDEIHLSVPEVAIVGVAELPGAIGIDVTDDVACVYQDMSGCLTGKARLIFHTHESRMLVQALVGSVSVLTGINMQLYEHEAMKELGNIIISVCISTMTDMLGKETRLAIPMYREGIFEEIIEEDSCNVGVLVMRTALTAGRRGINGVLIVTLSLPDIIDLLQSLDNFLAGCAGQQGTK
ncbi:MAG: chemotaxis protein CheC [Sideroxyarcus sp.]|nr:chemotaxis protein CheC [Sideroxyarcus sp.]